MKRSAAAAIFLGLSALGCGPEPEPAGVPGEILVVRFVDPQQRSGATRAPEAMLLERVPTIEERAALTIPTVTVGSDSRRVLMEHPRVRLAWRERTQPAAGGVLRIPLDHPDLTGSGLAAVSTTAWYAKEMLEFPLAIVPADADHLDLSIDGPAASAPELEFSAHAFPFASAETRYRTGLVDLPRDAHLRFATGGQERSSHPGSVYFTVSVCDEAQRCESVFHERRSFSARDDLGFHEERVDLARFGGERRSLLFETRFEHADGTDQAGVAFPVWANPELRAPGRVPAGTRRVLLISIDTLRSDHLGAYGYARETSPFLDGLAREGTLFTRFVSAATATGPSHMSIMTSLSPLRHGVTAGLAVLEAPVPMLAELLRANGFATAAVTENGKLARLRGFGRGFDEFVENRSIQAKNPAGEIEKTFSQGKRWLARNREVRAFLFLHSYQVHAPYQPPPRYAPLFAGDGLGRRGPNERQLDEYDREIRYTDDQLRDLVGWLAENQLLDDTLLILTSDHGEEFAEHGGLGHQSLPHEELVRVPLVLRGPAVPAGLRVDALATHVDVVPTILDLLGLPQPTHAEGRSLAPLLRDGTSAQRRNFAFSESWSRTKRFDPPALSIRDERYKLIRFQKGKRTVFQLFDLHHDPGERRNIAVLAPDRANALRARLDEYRAISRKAGADMRSDPDLERKLRALGYLE